ncbi:hypothetical protein LFX25_20420 [Leptospira sp. FAT2]|uniref:hypothetical protein n=1 Tax=Leptospira sanjuanensis TaxID=2879643 RepID=UPI001EE8A863|nr:hypothetical protein [Leptospira sanjuanensis]MCG6195611.1 hypothetical protein [Leptospira sanjuanensis]
MFLPFALFQSKNENAVVHPFVLPAINVGATISALIQVGNTVFVAGDFSSIGGVPRNGIAAVDVVTGNILPYFTNGGLGGSSTYLAFHYTGTILILGGGFTNFNGQARSGIVAIDPSSGNILPWYPSGGVGGPSFFITSFAQKGNVLYVAGHFTSIGGVARTRLAALDLNTANTLTWYPSGGAISGFPKKLLLSEDGNTLFIGGTFLQIGGQAKARLAAVDANTGSVSSFTPPTFSSSSSSTPFVEYLAQVGSKLFIAGDFTSVSSQSRLGFAVLDSNTGSLLPLNISLSGNPGYTIYTIAKKDTALYLAGYFSTVGGQTRYSIVSIDSGSLSVLAWYPIGGVGADYSISKMYQTSIDSVWVIGYFNQIGGFARNGIAKLSLF